MLDLKISVIQNNTKSTNLTENTKNIINKIKLIKNSSLIITSELAISGKVLQDLLLNEGFINKHQECLQSIVTASKEVSSKILLGTILKKDNKLYNAMVLIENGLIINTFYRNNTNNSLVFNEDNYFSNEHNALPLKLGKENLSILVDCETKDITNQYKDLSNNIVFIKTIPYTKENCYKQQLKEQAKLTGKNILHVNSLGYNNGLLFAGDTTLYSNNKILELNEPFKENIISIINNPVATIKEQENEIYNALYFGFKNYLQQHCFTKVVIGLSGGMDSAFCATLACDILGSKNVYSYMLSSKYTSESSLKDAKELADNLNCHHKVINIEDIVKENINTLTQSEKNIPLSKLALENIQARIRANVLMALSNSLQGSVLIATGNKSEIATGFCTLYGDTCGAIAPIGDVLKTKLYNLALFRNNNAPKQALVKAKNIIPQNIFTKAPSAELHENQKDEDRLPNYKELDRIINLLMEEGLSYNNVLDLVANKDTLTKTISLIHSNEFKRKLMPNVIKISKKSFLPYDWKFGSENNFKIIGK